MSDATIKKPGITIQKTYEDVELFLSDRNNVNVGDRIRVPSFKVPATVIDGEKKMNFNEVKVDGEYATVYYKDGTSLHLMFDRALFQSAVDYNNTKSWNDTQLAKYLKGAFSVELAKVLPATDCGLLRENNLWGKNARPFFKYGKNRVCFDNNKDVSVCYWLETPANASAAYFCRAFYNGDSSYGDASYASSFVRPRFTIPILDISQLCAELYYEHTLKEVKK